MEVDDARYIGKDSSWSDCFDKQFAELQHMSPKMEEALANTGVKVIQINVSSPSKDLKPPKGINSNLDIDCYRQNKSGVTATTVGDLNSQRNDEFNYMSSRFGNDNFLLGDGVGALPQKFDCANGKSLNVGFGMDEDLEVDYHEGAASADVIGDSAIPALSKEYLGGRALILNLYAPPKDSGMSCMGMDSSKILSAMKTKLQETLQSKALDPSIWSCSSRIGRPLVPHDPLGTECKKINKNKGFSCLIIN